MKNIITLFALLTYSNLITAQAISNKNTIDLVEKLNGNKNNKSCISFTVNGKTYTDNADVIETENGHILIGSSLIADNTPNTALHLYIEKKQAGAQTLSSKKKTQLHY